MAQMIALEEQPDGLAMTEPAGIERGSDEEGLLLRQVQEFQGGDEVVEMPFASDRLRLAEIDAERIGERRLEKCRARR